MGEVIVEAIGEFNISFVHNRAQFSSNFWNRKSVRECFKMLIAV